jgi:hypothetical protein
VAGPWKKTDENPLDSGAYCHLLVFPIVPLIRTLRGSLDTIAADVSMASRMPPLDAYQGQLAIVYRVGTVPRMRCL